MNRKKKYFLVYDDGTHTYYIEQLLNSVKEFGKDFEIIVFKKEEIDENFKNENKEILEMSRGGGYWLWKPYIVNEILKKINEGDYLFYMDSMYYFTEDFTFLYQDFFNKKDDLIFLENDFLIWENKPNESPNHMKNLCKMDVIKKYNMHQKILSENANEYWAGCFILKKTSRTVFLIKEWLKMCCNKHDLTDEQSNIQNLYEFHDHRHDQSLLSILLHKNDIPAQVFERRYLQYIKNPY